eukprot:8009745-Pyramimonas_sp.AAC.1
MRAGEVEEMQHLALALGVVLEGQVVAAHVPGEEQTDLRGVELRLHGARGRLDELDLDVAIDHRVDSR